MSKLNSTLIVLPAKNSAKVSLKIAGFDIDWTIIKTKSGNIFAKNYDDWTLWHSNVYTKLQTLIEQDYTVVFFTNQSGLTTKRLEKDALLNKFRSILNNLKIDATVMISSADDVFRKPSPFMWNEFVKNYNANEFCKESSFYVGDAAGRCATDLNKKDFSDSDKKFAHNVGVKFYTPEQFFLEQDLENNDEHLSCVSLDSLKISKIENSLKTEENISHKFQSNSEQELIVCVGYPASTKSTFVNKFIAPNNYTIVSQDILKTKAKCIKQVDALINAGTHVVLDNTSPSREARKIYIDIANKYKCKIRCFWFATDFDTSMKLNMFREKKSNGAHKHIPKIAYYKYRKSFEEPTIDEGFEEVVKIEFVCKFDSDEDANLFNQEI